MATKHLITVTDFCVYHEVEHSFIISLQEAGLVQVTVTDQIAYIPESELQKLEKIIRLYHELDINIAGIEAITHLLQKLEDTQEEVRVLKNKLNIYE